MNPECSANAQDNKSFAPFIFQDKCEARSLSAGRNIPNHSIPINRDNPLAGLSNGCCLIVQIAAKKKLHFLLKLNLLHY